MNIRFPKEKEKFVTRRATISFSRMTVLYEATDFYSSMSICNVINTVIPECGGLDVTKIDHCNSICTASFVNTHTRTHSSTMTFQRVVWLMLIPSNLLLHKCCQEMALWNEKGPQRDVFLPLLFSLINAFQIWNPSRNVLRGKLLWCSTLSYKSTMQFITLEQYKRKGNAKTATRKRNKLFEEREGSGKCE
jgi:hypothetical protein